MFVNKSFLIYFNKIYEKFDKKCLLNKFDCSIND